MKLSRGKINRIRNAKNQSRINMKKITKLGGSKSRYVKSNRKGTNVKGTNVKGTNVKGGARKRRYTNVKKRRAFNLRTKTIKMRQKGGGDVEDIIKAGHKFFKGGAAATTAAIAGAAIAAVKAAAPAAALPPPPPPPPPPAAAPQKHVTYLNVPKSSLNVFCLSIIDRFTPSWF